MILIGDYFHFANDTTCIVGIKRNNFNFKFPCIFDLFVGGKFIQQIKVEGVALTNDYQIDECFGKITVWVKGHLEKEIIENKVDAYLTCTQ